MCYTNPGDGLFSSMLPILVFQHKHCVLDRQMKKRFPGCYMAGKKTARVLTHRVSNTVSSDGKAELQEAVVPQTRRIVRLWPPVSSEDAPCLKTYSFLFTYTECRAQCLRGLSLG